MLKGNSKMAYFPTFCLNCLQFSILKMLSVNSTSTVRSQEPMPFYYSNTKRQTEKIVKINRNKFWKDSPFNCYILYDLSNPRGQTRWARFSSDFRNQHSFVKIECLKRCLFVIYSKKLPFRKSLWGLSVSGRIVHSLVWYMQPDVILPRWN